MRAKGWKGFIPALGVEKYAYGTIARTVEIPRVKYGWSAPMLDQGQTIQCGPYSFAELYWTTMRQNGLEPVLINPQELTDAYAKATGEPFDGVHNRVMMDVAKGLYGLKAYHTLDASNLDEALNCLAEGYNFLTGIPVYQSFEDAEDGIVPMPGKGDKFLGGHDVLIQGFDQDRGVFYGQNHWAGWGFEGHSYVGACHFTLPFAYRSLMADSWTITL